MGSTWNMFDTLPQWTYIEGHEVPHKDYVQGFWQPTNDTYGFFNLLSAPVATVQVALITAPNNGSNNHKPTKSVGSS
jgi:hypothetical protein